jgi:hypothetical protein
MKELVLHLPEQKFSEAPTRTQQSNLYRDISKFLNMVAASVIVDEQYMVNDPQCGEIFNVATKLKAVADFIDNPQQAHAAGLATPQPGPIPMMRR